MAAGKSEVVGNRRGDTEMTDFASVLIRGECSGRLVRSRKATVWACNLEELVESRGWASLFVAGGGVGLCKNISLSFETVHLPGILDDTRDALLLIFVGDLTAVCAKREPGSRWPG